MTTPRFDTHPSGVVLEYPGWHLPAVTHRPLAATFTAIAGVDLSMTNTGVAVYRRPFITEPEETVLARVQTKPETFASGPLETLKGGKVRPSTTWMDRHRRMSHIQAKVLEVVPTGSLVFVEAPAYGSAGAGTFDRSGLWWRLFVSLEYRQCRVIPVSPAQRMLYATGKGGGKDAGKDAVIAAVTRRYPWLDVTDNNVADALVLCMMARRAAGDPGEIDGIPAANLKALDKLESI